MNEATIAAVLDGMDLTDKQWAVLESFFLPRSRPNGRGRPFREARAVLNGVLWVLRTGAPWHDLPARYPPYQTVIAASNSGNAVVGWTGCCNASPKTFATAAIDLTEAFVDGHGLPLAVHVASASPYEPRLVPATLDARFPPDLPQRLIGDRGYE